MHDHPLVRSLASVFLLFSAHLVYLHAQSPTPALDNGWSTDFGLPGLEGLRDVGYSEDGTLYALADEVWRWDLTQWTRVEIPTGQVLIEGDSVQISPLRFNRTFFLSDETVILGTPVDQGARPRLIAVNPETLTTRFLGGPIPNGLLGRVVVNAAGDYYLTILDQTTQQRRTGLFLLKSDGAWERVGEVHEGGGLLASTYLDQVVMVLPDPTIRVLLHDGGEETLIEVPIDSTETYLYSYHYLADSLLYLLLFNNRDRSLHLQRLDLETLAWHDLGLLPEGTVPVVGGGLVADAKQNWWVTTTRGLMSGSEAKESSLVDTGYVPASVRMLPDGSVIGLGGSSSDDLLLERAGIASIDLGDSTPEWRALYDRSGVYHGIDGLPRKIGSLNGYPVVYGWGIGGVGVDGSVVRGDLLALTSEGWERIPLPMYNGSSLGVQVVSMYESDEGLWLTGRFDSIPGQRVSGIAMWDGEEWSAPPATDLFLPVGGQILIVEKWLYYLTNSREGMVLAQFRENEWGALHTEPNVHPSAFALAPSLGFVMGGDFRSVAAVAGPGIASFTPATTWHEVGNGLLYRAGYDPSPCYGQDAVAAGDFANIGDDLYVAGRLHGGRNSSTGQAVVSGGVVRWDGVEWQVVGQGLAADRCVDMKGIEADDEVIYALGSFSHTNLPSPFGTELRTGGVAFYEPDRDLWTHAGRGVERISAVGYLTLDGLLLIGDDLFTIGAFTHAGGVSSVGIARFSRPDPVYDIAELPDTINFGTLAQNKVVARDLLLSNTGTSTRTFRLDIGSPRLPWVFDLIGGGDTVREVFNDATLRLSPGQSVTLRLRLETGVTGTFADSITLSSEQIPGFPRTIHLRAERNTSSVEEDLRRDPLLLDLTLGDPRRSRTGDPARASESESYAIPQRSTAR